MMRRDVAVDGANGRLGRKRDHTRDADILDAAIDELSAVGYSRMTVDMVAARAKASKATLYRRWPSKADLVLEAVSRLASQEIDLDALPDTGTLRGDMLSMYKDQSFERGERKAKALAALATLLSEHPEFAEAGEKALVEPWTSLHRLLIRRAVSIGELREPVDLDFLAAIVPSLVAYRLLVQRRPLDGHHLARLIDYVLLPALGVSGCAGDARLSPEALEIPPA